MKLDLTRCRAELHNRRLCPARSRGRRSVGATSGAPGSIHHAAAEPASHVERCRSPGALPTCRLPGARSPSAGEGPGSRSASTSTRPSVCGSSGSSREDVSGAGLVESRWQRGRQPDPLHRPRLRAHPASRPLSRCVHRLERCGEVGAAGDRVQNPGALAESKREPLPGAPAGCPLGRPPGAFALTVA